MIITIRTNIWYSYCRAYFKTGEDILQLGAQLHAAIVTIIQESLGNLDCLGYEVRYPSSMCSAVCIGLQCRDRIHAFEAVAVMPDPSRIR